MAFVKPLTSFIGLPPQQPLPYEGIPPYGYPPYEMQIPRPMNQFGINAGIYAGSYGNGYPPPPSFPYSGNSLMSAYGPYGGINNHVGGSYSGLSPWPFIPPW